MNLILAQRPRLLSLLLSVLLCVVGINCTAVTSCRQLTTSGSYELTQDVLEAGGICINIKGNNIIFEGMKTTSLTLTLILYKGGGWNIGNTLLAVNVENVNNITIRNFTVSSMAQSINLTSCKDCIVEYVSILNTPLFLYRIYIIIKTTHQ